MYTDLKKANSVIAGHFIELSSHINVNSGCLGWLQQCFVFTYLEFKWKAVLPLSHLILKCSLSLSAYIYKPLMIFFLTGFCLCLLFGVLVSIIIVLLGKLLEHFPFEICFLWLRGSRITAVKRTNVSTALPAESQNLGLPSWFPLFWCRYKVE